MSKFLSHFNVLSMFVLLAFLFYSQISTTQAPLQHWHKHLNPIQLYSNKIFENTKKDNS
jgi:hypothetical protein